MQRASVFRVVQWLWHIGVDRDGIPFPIRRSFFTELYCRTAGAQHWISIRKLKVTGLGNMPTRNKLDYISQLQVAQIKLRKTDFQSLSKYKITCIKTSY